MRVGWVFPLLKKLFYSPTQNRGFPFWIAFLFGYIVASLGYCILFYFEAKQAYEGIVVLILFFLVFRFLFNWEARIEESRTGDSNHIGVRFLYGVEYSFRLALYLILIYSSPHLKDLLIYMIY